MHVVRRGCLIEQGYPWKGEKDIGGACDVAAIILDSMSQYIGPCGRSTDE